MDRAPEIIVTDPTVDRGAPVRVCIAVPSTDHVHANFAMNALAPLLYGLGIRRTPIALVNTKGSLVAKNRDNAVLAAQGYKCEWLLFLDSDITFPADALERLLAHDKDIVGATYARRTPPHSNLAKPKDGAPATVSGLVEVDALPTGCLLIRMSVFEKLRRPYFRCGALEEGERIDDIEGPATLGEDYNFCRDAKAAGFGIWMDTELSFELVHWGEMGFRLADGQAADAPRFEQVELAPQ